MRKILAAFALLTGILPGLSQAELINLEEAVESERAELLLNGPGQGTVLVHDCKECPIRFAIDANTWAVLGETSIPLEEARSHMRRGVTVIFDAKTRIVTRLLLR